MAAPTDIDARLLRFRRDPTLEPPAPLIDALLTIGRHEDALAVVKTAIETVGEDGMLLLGKGRALIARGDLERAQLALVRAAKLAPTRKEPLRWLGEVLLKRGDPVRAEKILEKAVGLDPADRAIKLLHERSARLARIAESDGDELARPSGSSALPPAAQARPLDEEDDAKTFVRDNPYAVEAAARASAQPTPGVPPAAPARAPAAGPPAGASPHVATRAQLPPMPSSDDQDLPTLQSRTVATASPDLPIGPPVTPLAMRSKQVALPPSPTDLDDDSSTQVRPRGGPGFDEEAVVSPFGPARGARPPTARTRNAQPVSSAPPPPMMGAALGGAPPPPPPPSFPMPSASPFGAAEGYGIDGSRRARPEARPYTAPLAEPAADPRDFAPLADPRDFAPAADPRDFAPVADPRDFAPAPFAPAPFAPTPGVRLRGPDGEGPTVITDYEPATVPRQAAISGPGSTEERTDADQPFSTGLLPDEALGGNEGEDPDDILAMLAREGIFEPPNAVEQATPWTKPVREKTGLVRVFVFAWVLVAAAIGGGFFGYTKWIEHKHTTAAAMVAQARRDAWNGDHKALVDAERQLVLARDAHPRSEEAIGLLALVQALRSLDDGGFDTGFMRGTLHTADQMGVKPGQGRRQGVPDAYVFVARAVLAAAERREAEARPLLQQASRIAPRDGAVLYVSARLAQRFGDEGALDQLRRAHDVAPTMLLATIAFAESLLDQGDGVAAAALVRDALRRKPGHLRATLWLAFINAPDTDPSAGLSELDRLRSKMLVASPSDRALVELIRARLQRRRGQDREAAEAVTRALGQGGADPRVMALAATEALAIGQLATAERAAIGALSAAPSNAELRKLLATVALARFNGERAIRALEGVPDDDPEARMLRARAAFIEGEMEAAGRLLDAAIAADPEATAATALRIRVLARSDAATALTRARALSERAPGDLDALLALGESALLARDAATATTALTQAVAASPRSDDGHYLLGRAHRLGGRFQESEAALRRALEISPEHMDAQLALAGLLLDRGRLDEADEVFTRIARTPSGLVPGRLGRAEVLLLKGQNADARAQLDAIGAQYQDSPRVKLLRARVLMAERDFGRALSLLRPLAEPQTASADILALYAEALMGAEQWTAAGPIVDRALALDGQHPEALLGRALGLLHAGDGRGARPIVDEIRRALTQRTRPPQFQARALLAEARIALLDQEADRAAELLRQASSMVGAPPEVHFFLGEALSTRNSAQAADAYREYLRREPNGPYVATARRALPGGR
ncbi:MAG: tetratricopeptide repeat protein [Deltaproteobacteria bacterium]|nr:tetratricopeptide repeat protein [Deltaproteobacteria bacterium]